MEIGLIALPTSSICNPAQKSSRQIKINNLPLEWPAKTPADRGKSVNGGQGDVIFRWELPQSEPDGFASSLWEGAFGGAAMVGAQGMTEWERYAARIFRWIYFYAEDFFHRVLPVGPEKVHPVGVRQTVVSFCHSPAHRGRKELIPTPWGR